RRRTPAPRSNAGPGRPCTGSTGRPPDRPGSSARPTHRAGIAAIHDLPPVELVRPHRPARMFTIGEGRPPAKSSQLGYLTTILVNCPPLRACEAHAPLRRSYL